jgi:8-oxo-dGTP diphosphatase
MKPEAIVAVLRHGNRVLVLRRGPGTILPGYWAPLSGRIEPGETQEEAVIRETKEEVGLRATPLEKVWECETEDGQFLLHWWIAEAGAGELEPDPDEVSDVRWIEPEEFAHLEPTFAGDREFFARILPGIRQTEQGKGRADR